MPALLEKHVRGLRRRFALAAWSGEWSRHLALATVPCGSAALLARALLEWPAERAALALLPLALTPITAWTRARRRVPSPAGVLAWLDLRTGATGTVLTLEERPDERWRARLEERLARLPDPPSVRLGRSLGRVAAAAAFALLALLVPMVAAEPGPPRTLFERSVDALRDQLSAVVANADLDEETARELGERVERLADEAATAPPESLLEGIDALSARLLEEAGGAAGESSLLRDAMRRVTELASSDPELAARLAGGALERLRTSGRADDLLAELPPELAALASGPALERALQLSPEELQRLGSFAERFFEGRLSALARAGLAQLAEGDLEARARRLAELLDATHVCDASCAEGGCPRAASGGGLAGALLRAWSSGGDPGSRGGLARGPGAAAPSWGEEGPERREEFAARPLPAGRSLDVEHSAALATGLGAPEVAPQRESGGAADVVASPGAATWKRRLSPRHRRVVQRWFSADGGEERR